MSDLAATHLSFDASALKIPVDHDDVNSSNMAALILGLVLRAAAVSVAAATVLVGSAMMLG